MLPPVIRSAHTAPVAPFVVALLRKFMFFSEIDPAPVADSPRADMPVIVPPVPATAPVPVTEKDPVVLLSTMPFAALEAFTLSSVTSSGTFDALNAVALVDAIVLPLLPAVIVIDPPVV